MSDEPTPVEHPVTQVIMISINTLLATYERAQHFGDRTEIAGAYLTATARFDRGIVIKALNRFIEGRVDDHDPAMLPTAPELAHECQQLVYEMEPGEFDMGSGGSPVLDRVSVPANDETVVLLRRPEALPDHPKGAA